jgi:hypothetical protein
LLVAVEPTTPSAVVVAGLEAGVPAAAKASKHATEEATAQHESALDIERLVQNWQIPSASCCSCWARPLVPMTAVGHGDRS